MVARVCLFAVGFGLLVLTGCAGPRIAPVKGRVMFNGQPVKQAQITFSPVARSDGDREPGKPATGFTEDDGTFVLSTYQREDGAQVGTHDVTVALDDTNPARCKRLKTLTWEVKPGGNELTIEMDPRN